MDRSSVTESDVERARLKAVVGRSTDDDRLVPLATAYLKADRGKRLELTDDDRLVPSATGGQSLWG